jgi:hypothetical protein
LKRAVRPRAGDAPAAAGELVTPEILRHEELNGGRPHRWWGWTTRQRGDAVLDDNLAAAGAHGGHEQAAILLGRSEAGGETQKVPVGAPTPVVSRAPTGPGAGA